MKSSYLLLLVLLLQGNVLSSCKKDSVKTPDLTLSGTVFTVEGSTDQHKAMITVTLSEASDNQVSLTYSTIDSSAKVGQDFEGVTDGTLTFSPGETAKTIEISIIPDENLEFDEVFQVSISNVKNANAPVQKSTVTITNDDTYTAELATDGYITPATYPGMELLWADEFDGAGLNTTWWNYETGGGGWGNNELEFYTNSIDNVFIENGHLNIKAIKSSVAETYTSGRLTTKGKKEFTYGRIDIRAKLPQGQGIWPALWMLGANISEVSWPDCGEIDIMEFLGNDLTTVYGSAHYENGGHQYKTGSYVLAVPDNYCTKFHVFTIMWHENSIQYFVDYHKYYEVTVNAIKFGAFKKPQFFIFNLAVGGDWPGNPNAATVFPQILLVDYVRVFQ